MTEVFDSLPAQPLIGHLIELRKRLLICALFFGVATGICYIYAEQIYGFLLYPLEMAMHGKERRLIYTGLTEAFMTYMKVAFFAGGLLTLPMVLLQIWRFIAPGLFVHERKAIRPFLIATPLLFLAGLAMAFYGVIPVAWQFFVAFDQRGQGTLPIVMELRISEYLTLTMTLLMIFGMAFELPVLLGLLAKTGVVKGTWLAKNRKYAFLAILIVAAVLSPPDVISQTGLALPLYGLYEVSILVVRWMEKQKPLPVDDEIDHA
jgi:sec-independent protein translocase protein TatC